MKNFTSFTIAFLHLASSLVISCGVGTFRMSSVLEEIFDSADVAKLSICTSLLGLDFLHLLRVITLLVVLTKNGAVINLYAEVSKPSFFGAASGVLLTSDCSTKQVHLVVCIALNSRSKYHCLSSFLQYVLILHW